MRPSSMRWTCPSHLRRRWLQREGMLGISHCWWYGLATWRRGCAWGIANGKSSSGVLSHLGGPSSLPQSKVLRTHAWYRYTFWCSQSGISFSRVSFSIWTWCRCFADSSGDFWVEARVHMEMIKSKGGRRFWFQRLGWHPGHSCSHWFSWGSFSEAKVFTIAAEFVDGSLHCSLGMCCQGSIISKEHGHHAQVQFWLWSWRGGEPPWRVNHRCGYRLGTHRQWKSQRHGTRRGEEDSKECRG